MAALRWMIPNLPHRCCEPLTGYTLLRTDRNGWIELSSDGERMWVDVERGVGTVSAQTNYQEKV